MRKIISFDLDMTLLNHANYEIPQSALLAIDKLRRKGHLIVIATGRDMENYHGRPFLEMLKPDAMIQLNGTKVTAGKEVLHSHIFDKALLRELASFCKEKGYAIGLTVDNDDYYFNREVVEKIDNQRWGVSGRNFADPEKIFDMDIRSLAYVGDKEGAYDIEKHFPQLRLPLFAGVLGADVLEKGNSKADGLRLLCKYYDIDIKDTVAFGDSLNDMEIIADAGIGIAMGNAVEELKNIADMITDDIDKDGIYNACIKLGLIEGE